MYGYWTSWEFYGKCTHGKRKSNLVFFSLFGKILHKYQKQKRSKCFRMIVKINFGYFRNNFVFDIQELENVKVVSWIKPERMDASTVKIVMEILYLVPK